MTAMKAKSSIDSVREIVQEFLVPELKAVKISIESLHNEMKLRDEKQTQAIAHLDDKLSRQISNSVQFLSDKFDSSVEFRERLASLEARIPRN